MLKGRHVFVYTVRESDLLWFVLRALARCYRRVSQTVVLTATAPCGHVTTGADSSWCLAIGAFDIARCPYSLNLFVSYSRFSSSRRRRLSRARSRQLLSDETLSYLLIALTFLLIRARPLHHNIPVRFPLCVCLVSPSFSQWLVWLLYFSVLSPMLLRSPTAIISVRTLNTVARSSQRRLRLECSNALFDSRPLNWLTTNIYFFFEFEPSRKKLQPATLVQRNQKWIKR